MYREQVEGAQGAISITCHRFGLTRLTVRETMYGLDASRLVCSRKV